MLAIIQIRRDTATNWATANPVLSQGEIGIVLATNPTEFRVGDGVTRWNSLQVQTLLTETVKTQIIAGLTSTVAQLQEQLSNEITVRTSQIAALTTAVAGKVDKGSWDVTLHAGLADNLYDSNGGNSDSSHVTARSTGGSVSLSSGPAEFSSYRGFTVRQLCQNPDSPSSQSISTIPGHVYYVEVLAKHSTTVLGSFGSNAISLPYVDRWCFAGMRVSAAGNSTVLSLELTASVKYCNIIDLTEHQLAASLTTAALCAEYFGYKSKPYGLNSVSLTSFDSVGFNQFDASTMVYNKTMSATGVVSDSTNHSLICMPCIKGESGSGKNNGYRIHVATAGSIIRVGYSPIPVSDSSFDKGYDIATPGSVTDYDYLPTGVGYLLIAVLNADVATAIVHFKWSYSSFTTQYANESTYQLSSLPIVASAINAIGSVYDTAFLKTRVITRLIATKLLNGVENWNYVPPVTDEGGTTTKNGYFYIDFTCTAGQLLCSKYTNMPTAITALEDKCIRATGSQLQIVDTAYTTVVDFVAALVASPVTVLHPSTETVDTIPDTQNYTYTANDFGVERVVPSNGVFPLIVTLVYLTNLKDKLRNLPDDAISATGDEVTIISQSIAALYGSLAALKLKNYNSIDVINLNMFKVPTLGGMPWVIEGSGAPSFAPDFVGQRYIDTTNKISYTGCGTTSSSDFRPNNN